MRLLVNALSVTNPSGRQVFCGHLAEWLRADPGPLELLLHAGNLDLPGRLAAETGGPPGDRWRVVTAPAWTRHWAGRAVYERLCLPRLAARLAPDACLSFSGGWTPGLSCAQYTLALNPWALVPGVARGAAGRLKAALQRRAYRLAVRRADGIGYASGFLRDRYRANAGGLRERAGAVVYPALGEREAAALDAAREAGGPRDPLVILCVSLMAPHKDIATLLEAVRILRAGMGVPARLRLVGGWSDRGYRRAMERIASGPGLRGAVEFAGPVPREALRAAYRSARVYALLSRCESFGIPSVEAQRAGTPVVAALGCAAPEVCGEGGLYAPAGDAPGAARHLLRLLTDEAAWEGISSAALRNAARFEYRKTSAPLVGWLAGARPGPVPPRPSGP